MKVQLILEGGGMRGIYTVGVLDYFLAAGIEFHSVVGVSAGAGAALDYLAKDPGRSKKVFLDFLNDDRYLSFKSYRKTGSYFGLEFIYKEMPKTLLPFKYEAFKKSKAELTVVATNRETGEAVYFPLRDAETDADYLIASCSIPGACAGIEIAGVHYYDGGCADPIPIHYSQAQGFEKQVLVLTRNYGYKKKERKLTKVFSALFREYEPFRKTLEQQWRTYNDLLYYIDNLEEKGQVFTIRPTEQLVVERYTSNAEALEVLYRQGYEDAKARHAALMAYCAGCSNVKFRKRKKEPR